MIPPFLLEAEVAALTSPLTQAAAQKRFLKRIGVPFVPGADGRPLVSRTAVGDRLALGDRTPLGDNSAAAQIVMAGSQEPNRDALLARLASRKKKGAKADGKTA